MVSFLLNRFTNIAPILDCCKFTHYFKHLKSFFLRRMKISVLVWKMSLTTSRNCVFKYLNILQETFSTNWMTSYYIWVLSSNTRKTNNIRIKYLYCDLTLVSAILLGCCYCYMVIYWMMMIFVFLWSFGICLLCSLLEMCVFFFTYLSFLLFFFFVSSTRHKWSTWARERCGWWWNFAMCTMVSHNWITLKFYLCYNILGTEIGTCYQTFIRITILTKTFYYSSHGNFNYTH